MNPEKDPNVYENLIQDIMTFQFRVKRVVVAQLIIYLEANKIFPVCFLQLCSLLFLSDSLGGLSKIKARNNVAFLTRVNRKHG